MHDFLLIVVHDLIHPAPVLRLALTIHTGQTDSHYVDHIDFEPIAIFFPLLLEC